MLFIVLLRINGCQNILISITKMCTEKASITFKNDNSRPNVSFIIMKMFFVVTSVKIVF